MLHLSGNLHGSQNAGMFPFILSKVSCTTGDQRPAGTAYPNLPNLSSHHTCSNQWSGRPPASTSHQPPPGDHGQAEYPVPVKRVQKVRELIRHRNSILRKKWSPQNKTPMKHTRHKLNREWHQLRQ